MGSKVEFQTASNMSFPNITVCHTRYFDKARMAGMLCQKCFMNNAMLMLHIAVVLEYGVNDSLASYMTSILNMGYAKEYETYKSSTSIGEHYIMAQNQSEQALNLVLQENNFTLLELFEAMAIRYNLDWGMATWHDWQPNFH